MPSRTAKLVSAILVNILAGLLLTTVARGEPAAAEGCLSTPWGDAPAGSQWRYHIDHVNKGKCWYLRRLGGEQSEALPQNTAAAPKVSAPPSPPAKPSVVDARAELRQQAVREPAGIPSVNAAGNPADSASSANTPVANGAAAVATRWPDLPAAGSPPNAAPAATAANDVAQTSGDPAQAIVPSIPFAHISVPMRPQTFWSLVAATIGALAFAGIAALISKRGRARRLRRRVTRSTRRPIWETTDDDRIALSDHPNPDSRDYRPRFGRSAGAAAASSVRARESASRAPRYARR
jgi:hypothetical protein